MGKIKPLNTMIININYLKINKLHKIYNFLKNPNFLIGESFLKLCTRWTRSENHVFLKKLISFIREVILKNIEVCTVWNDILRGDENFDFPY